MLHVLRFASPVAAGHNDPGRAVSHVSRTASPPSLRRVRMAIHFHCPSCQAPLKLKDQYAGRRGTCPQCHATIVVPAIATADSSSATTKNAGPAQQSSTIDFRCTGCHKRIRAPQTAAGRQVACPSCGTKLRVRGAVPAVKPVSSPAPAASAAVATQPAAVGTFEDLSDALFGDAASDVPANFDASSLASPAATTRAARTKRPAWLLYAAFGGGALVLLVILGFAAQLMFGSRTSAPASRITIPPPQPTIANPAPPADTPLPDTAAPVDDENAPVPPPEAQPREDAAANAVPDENDPRAPGDPASAPTGNEKKPAATTSPDAATDHRSDAAKAEARAEEFVTAVERSIALSEDIMAVSRKITDVPSAQKHAATWAGLTADAMQLADEQNTLAGETLTGQHAARFQTAKRRDAQQAKDAQAELARLQKLPEVMAILKSALEKRVTELKISPISPE